MTRRSLPLAIGLLLALGIVSSERAYAQGNGRPKAPRAPATTTTTSTSTSTSSTSTSSSTTATVDPLAGSATSFRQFGAWLDDAGALGRGAGYSSIGVGYWRMLGSSQTNLPMIAVGVGVSDRMQVSASVPFYHAQYPGGSASGMDDVYFGAKYTLVDPTLTVSEFGLAISPTVEVLSSGSADGRVHFAVPISMELRRQRFRVFGSAGIFTRGSFFSGGAIEWTGPSGFMLTGSLTQSYSLKSDLALDTLGIGRQRADVSLGVAHPLAASAVGFVTVGRSLTSLEEGGTSLAISGGVSLRFSATATP